MLTVEFGGAVFGTSGLSIPLLTGDGWVINLAVVTVQAPHIQVVCREPSLPLSEAKG